MIKFIRELRRREVFRTAGLYVGICWIVIEVASVILPAFDAPPWLFRGAIIAAIAGFPVILVLAWFLDVNKEGISLETDPTDTVVEQSGVRKSDFAIIGVLVLALIVSLSLNLSNETPVTAELESVSVLVASFAKPTDEPLFDHVLEEALVVGIEVAPHITVFEGNKTPGRAGIDFLLTGSLQPSGNGYRIKVEGIDVLHSQSAFTIDEKAGSRDAVLQAIGKLSAKVRKQLGDTTSEDHHGGQARNFMAESLEAAHAYASARQLEIAGKLEEAAEYYEQAIVADPNLGRAFSSLALVEFTLGRADEAAQHWTKALSLMNTMTERERLRALGRYSASVAIDGDAATEIYARFVDKYPADLGARDNYASASFQQLDFATAVEQTRKILAIFPADNFYRAKLALYAMYRGDWETAANEAEKVVAADPEFGTAYLPMAMAALARGQADSSRDAYRRMALTDNPEDGASVAELGLADIDLYFGEAGAAQERLKTGIDTDISNDNHRMAALKYIALAQSYAEQENFSAATAAAANAVSSAHGNESMVPAAMIYIQAGDLTSAKTIIDELAERPDAHSRAYAQMLKGMILASEGAQTEAILAMRGALATADMWLIRYQTGKAYLQAKSYPEAMGELTTMNVRRGEATSAFLDNMPTYRLLAELPYWTGRVQEALKMGSAARASYEQYVSLRPHGGALAQDASERAANLK
jgi:tetratricopeptide (TPR) repeat protein